LQKSIPPIILFQEGKKLFGVLGVSLDVFLGEDVPQDFTFAALKGLGGDVLPPLLHFFSASRQSLGGKEGPEVHTSLQAKDS